MNDWQPIETAPKDGEPIDVWVKSFDVGPGGSLTVSDVGRRTDVRWDEPRYYGAKTTRRFPETWCVSDYECVEAIEVGDWRVTHWMPLPSPPDLGRTG